MLGEAWKNDITPLDAVLQRMIHEYADTKNDFALANQLDRLAPVFAALKEVRGINFRRLVPKKRKRNWRFIGAGV